MLVNIKIPEMERDLSSCTENLEEKQLMLAGEKVNLNKPLALMEMCKVIIADAALLDQYQSDINRINITIARLEQSIVKVSSNRSRQETEAEIDIIKAELSNLKNRLDSSKGILDQHKDRCHQLNKNIQNEVQKQIDIQKLVQEKPLLEIQLTENSDNSVTLNREIEELNETLESRITELRTAEAAKQQTVRNNTEVKEKEQNRINKLKNILRDIQKLQQDMEQYIRNDTDGKLDRALEELEKFKLKLRKKEDSKTQIIDDITKKKEILAKRESEFRALEDNITLREIEKAEAELLSKITTLEQKIGGYNYRSVRDEKERIERTIDKSKREISLFQGQKEEIEKQVRDLEIELGKPQNKNAYNDFKKQYYELRLEKFLVDDLAEYVKVLEKSVLKFHEERMVQINRTIRELWRSIYRGNDIDYIEIKTDEHMVGGVNKRRTYNYKGDLKTVF